MATIDYNQKVALAKKLLNKFGATVIITSPYDHDLWKREYDPVEETSLYVNTNTGAKRTSPPDDVIQKPDGVTLSIDDELLKNSLVKTTDMKLLVSGINKPVSGDTYIVNGLTYQYIADIPVCPGGTDILYSIAIRK